MLWQRLRFVSLCIVVPLWGCESLTAGPALSKAGGVLDLGERVPRQTEQDTIGQVVVRVSREMPDYRALLRNPSSDIVFKDEESTGADRMMTRRLTRRLATLNQLVRREWDGVSVRVTEAWDENGEHGPASAHYEGRAVDLTTSDIDPSKLGRLAFLAVEAGFDWVYFEDRTHVHASVRR
jgi:hedgehog signaling domain-containing protein